jgi:hypothetical protein
MSKHRIVAVTAAGRKVYLEILKSYILKDNFIAEWHLWDNCRQQSDREYIEQLAKQHPKIKIVKAFAATDGSNRSINQFYRTTIDLNTFYIKLDDDIVYMPEGFAAKLYDQAVKERGRYTYWSPLVVNNAICTWLLKYHSRVKIDANVMASAACPHGWRSPVLAKELHSLFISALKEGREGNFCVPNFDIALARFSINCIGFFGADSAAWGDKFCPLNVDDEEWISAVLPSLVGRPGRVLGDIVVAHFSFFTQEDQLLRTTILDEYYKLAGLLPQPLVVKKKAKKPLRAKLRRMLELRWFSGDLRYSIYLEQ